MLNDSNIKYNMIKALDEAELKIIDNKTNRVLVMWVILFISGSEVDVFNHNIPSSGMPPEQCDFDD
jgi:methyl coenzyme M reductase subunit C-like uncharacterized protein (methanogenesis marker protein 7)